MAAEGNLYQAKAKLDGLSGLFGDLDVARVEGHIYQWQKPMEELKQQFANVKSVLAPCQSLVVNPLGARRLIGRAKQAVQSFRDTAQLFKKDLEKISACEFLSAATSLLDDSLRMVAEKERGFHASVKRALTVSWTLIGTGIVLLLALLINYGFYVQDRNDWGSAVVGAGDAGKDFQKAVSAYQTYVQIHPRGRHVLEAQKAIAELKGVANQAAADSKRAAEHAEAALKRAEEQAAQRASEVSRLETQTKINARDWAKVRSALDHTHDNTKRLELIAEYLSKHPAPSLEAPLAAEIQSLNAQSQSALAQEKWQDILKLLATQTNDIGRLALIDSYLAVHLFHAVTEAEEMGRQLRARVQAFNTAMDEAAIAIHKQKWAAACLALNRALAMKVNDQEVQWRHGRLQESFFAAYVAQTWSIRLDGRFWLEFWPSTFGQLMFRKRFGESIICATGVASYIIEKQADGLVLRITLLSASSRPGEIYDFKFEPPNVMKLIPTSAQ